MRGWIVALGLFLAAACTSSDAQRGTVQAAAASSDTAHPWRKPGDKIDSILPMEEYLRRFRGTAPAPQGLRGGAHDRDALARKFLAGLAAADSAELGKLLVTRAEFAWLVFPEHSYSRPPYELDPEIFWLQLHDESAKGLAGVLNRYSGKRLTLVGGKCQRDPHQSRIGPVRFWSDCQLRFRVGDSVETHRLFGSIVERDGRAKLLSFANEF